MRFRARVQLNGKTATGIQVPDEVVAGLGGGKHPQVRVAINAFTYRSSIASMGGVFMLPVSAEIRKSANVTAGDEVEVDIEIDSEPRQVAVPDDFRAALEQDSAAGRSFARLSYSNQLRHVLAIEQAKTAETRQRRIAKAIDTLRDDSSGHA